MDHRFIAVLALATASCGFGYGVERIDGLTLAENVGDCRYVYRSTRLVQAPARGPATPTLASPPAGAREIGLVEVTLSYSGGGARGLRTREADFYPTLATIAGELGGTHFMVLRSTRETRPLLGDWMTSLTTAVFAAPPP